MEPGEMRLPQLEGAFGLPSQLERIWKILFTVDPAYLKQFETPVLEGVGRTIISHQIAVARATANLNALEADAMQDVANQLKLG